ncbi:alpha/beta hydrolase family protein [Streptomyces auratus]|uniref:Alpha/beta fold hydrolase n=1 Tax=Streptomyces auratus AGR0001 TaxID=1160718 RepID=A0A8B1NRV1_9ACTN|nr:alpha/beta fold hydrolase [Streptomyces auratus]QTZ93430.1 alpha/beta fold hydrolase [Streptomyces auratus AGR0001]
MTPGPEAECAASCVPSITSSGHRVCLLTADGVRIEAAHTPRRARSEADPAACADTPAIVLAHGFTGALERPALRRAAAAFSQHADVITFSFRGHGGSGGRSTVGDREVEDLAAAVRWARALGHRRVATVGFSMGGSVVLRHAALHGQGEHGERTDAHPDTVVAVSAPARWYYRGTAAMRRLHWVITRPTGRLVSRLGLRTRIHPDDWDPVPLSPTEAAGLIAPTPLLVVHGDRDPYFPLDHPRMLMSAADPATAELWIERGFGHAENAAAPELLGRIGEWITAHTPA